LPPSFFHERVPVRRIEKRLGHGKVSAGFDLGVEASDFGVEIIRDGIHRDSDREIGLPAKSFPRPVGALIETVQNFHQADGIDFIDAAGSG